jgi:hypothetical protein
MHHLYKLPADCKKGKDIITKIMIYDIIVSQVFCFQCSQVGSSDSKCTNRCVVMSELLKCGDA